MKAHTIAKPPTAALIEREMFRALRLLPNGEPKYVRIYDNGGRTADRYTVVFTGRYARRVGQDRGYTLVLGMNSCPFHPQGIGICSEYGYRIDWPTYGHLGKKIKFATLPADCQQAVLDDYLSIWELPARIAVTERSEKWPYEPVQHRAWFDENRVRRSEKKGEAEAA
jgi:hypothetical protein